MIIICRHAPRLDSLTAPTLLCGVMNRLKIRAQLIEMLGRDETRIELDRAALLIAAEEYPQLDVDYYIAQLDGFAEELRPRLPSPAGSLSDLRRLRDYLFNDLGFRGNSGHYFDARNSFLNDVIDRRLGIPITLSVIFIEVGRRVGLELQGVGMPGHFIVKHLSEEGEVLFDPFNEGKELTADECRALIVEMYGGELIFHPSFLRAVSKQQIIVRMLQNLKGIYARANDHHKLLTAVERALLVTPESLTEIRDRGLALAGLGRWNQACEDLETYLRGVPKAEDAEQIRARIGDLKQRQAQLN
jgi:regulator of sirC expression with transglutaminase-like and TPR domain